MTKTSYKLLIIACIAVSGTVAAAEGEKARSVQYPDYPPAPTMQAQIEADRKSAGCVSCHTDSDAATMHVSNAVVLGCTDCHGGAAEVFVPAGAPKDSMYDSARDAAHVQPLYPQTWHYPSSANPERSYTLLNRESPEFIRFINPSDYRVASSACGACHQPIIDANVRSMMATGAMLWGGAAYNNGILPFKNYILGESYTPDGEPAKIFGAPIDPEIAARHGILPELNPLPAWESVKPGDVFRVFEDGGRNILNLFPETGVPNVIGQIQRLEEPGRPDIRQSNRGPGTGARISVPLINITKTRLNDPFTWFLGTNDQPGDYRSSGCASCHVVYANDRDPRHSGPYAAHGHGGTSASSDPTISDAEQGHPLKHEFTRAIPTSQCMVCHMHQPNMFVNSYLGYTMWDYESDAPFMWPEEQQELSIEEQRHVLDRNPEGAVVRGKWADVDFLKQVSEMNPDLNDTQFADYHGHGWNFRAVQKRDLRGNLLDADGAIVANDDPQKFDKAVHLSSIHVDKGLHCVDCHFTQDNHGNGHLYGEVASAIEIECKDCHGTSQAYPDLRTSGPAAPPGGTDMRLFRNVDGKRRFEWRDGGLIQRSVLDPTVEWELSLVKDSVNPEHEQFNEKAARAKLMSNDVATQDWGQSVSAADLAHKDEEIECYTCHTSWITSCAGCHLPIEANWKTERHHYEGGESRNYATYNPQVARDQMFMLGKRGPANDGKIAPVRSSSALVLSSTNANRERIYVQQPPIAASGFSSQAMNPHFPHTARKTETKTCSNCHLTEDGSNNAWMAQLLLQGTNFVNFVGFHAYAGLQNGIVAAQVTEWEEPQAVIGSYLHRFAYPDNFQQHLGNERELQLGFNYNDKKTACLQLRGEYLFAAAGKKGLVVYDVANVANKGFSQRIVTAPFAKGGHDSVVNSEHASCVALPTNQPVHPPRNEGELMRVTNQEQAFHPIYNYAFTTDLIEGLIVVDVTTFADGDINNNFLKRAAVWNPDNVLAGARHITIGGYYAYITSDRGLVIVNLDQPESPALVAVVPLDDARASALQFRYLFVTDRRGLHVVDVTDPANPDFLEAASIPMADAQRVYVARTYAYVAAGADGLAIIDLWSAEQPKLLRYFNAGGQIRDTHDVVVGSTNASLFAYLADGVAGIRVVQLTSPDSQPNFYGFSPEPQPELIATYKTSSAALSLSKGLDRDRGVDESGGQIAVFGRKGSRPLTLEEMQKLYLDDQGNPWYVEDE
ncbi:MAG: multiheme c-type cytochrome [Woeseiaceae bacterium]